MLQFVKSIGAYFGYRHLTFDLDRRSMGHLNLFNLLPLAVIVALVVNVIASYKFDAISVYDERSVWLTLFWASDVGLEFGGPLWLAVAFAAGMQKWSRAAGSWMLMIGLTLIVASAGFGAASIALFVATNVQEALELRVFAWTEWSRSLAFLAVGYFYVAYRAGLNRRPRRRFVRRRLAAH